MKKLILNSIAVAALLFTLASCKSKKETTKDVTTKDVVTTKKETTKKVTTKKETTAAHVHQFSDEWTTSETEHWHSATCGHDVTKDKGAHEYTDDDDASCNICGYNRVPEENDIVFNVKDRTYNGKQQGLVLNEDFTIKGGTVKEIQYKAKGAIDTEYTSVAPKNAGDYTAIVYISGNALIDSIFEEVDFTIKKKVLNDIYDDYTFKANNTVYTIAGNSSSTPTWGLCDGDSIQMTVTLKTDYTDIGGQKFAYAGEEKKIDSVVFSGGTGVGNYDVKEDFSNIHIEITPAMISLAGGPKNASAYNNIYVNASTSIPRLYFNLAYLGEKSHAWDSSEEITKFDGSEWVSIGSNYSEQSAYAVANKGQYKITYTITCYENYYVDGSNSYSLEFETKEAIELSKNSTITLASNEFAVYAIEIDDDHIYQIGDNIDISYDILKFNPNTASYSTAITDPTFNYNEYWFGNYTKLLLKVTANEDITNKILIKDISYGDTVELNSESNTGITTTNGENKWMQFYIDGDKVGEGDLLVELSGFDNQDIYVFDYNHDYTQLDNDEPSFVGTIVGQGDEIRIFVYLNSNLNNARIDYTSND